METSMVTKRAKEEIKSRMGLVWSVEVPVVFARSVGPFDDECWTSGLTLMHAIVKPRLPGALIMDDNPIHPFEKPEKPRFKGDYTPPSPLTSSSRHSHSENIAPHSYALHRIYRLR